MRSSNNLLLVHLFTVADMYIVLFDRIRADPEGTPNGREGYYFCVNGEHYMYDVCKKIAEALVQRGKGRSPEPTSFTEADLDKYYGVMFLLLGLYCGTDWILQM